MANGSTASTVIFRSPRKGQPESFSVTPGALLFEMPIIEERTVPLYRTIQRKSLKKSALSEHFATMLVMATSGYALAHSFIGSPLAPSLEERLLLNERWVALQASEQLGDDPDTAEEPEINLFK